MQARAQEVEHQEQEVDVRLKSGLVPAWVLGRQEADYTDRMWYLQAPATWT